MAAPPPPPAMPDLAHPTDLGATLRALMGDPDIADTSWIWRQYDHQVGTDTVIGPGGDAALVRVKGTNKILAFVCDANGHHVALDPRVGTAGQVAECARNLACVGATPIGLTDCMNFGNPEKPEIMWQFSESVDGMAEACLALEVPVVSGNVSLYNETDGRGILPTPGLAMVGLYEGPVLRVRARLPGPGLLVALIGAQGRGHLGGSLYARRVLGVGRAGGPPPVDFAAERALHDALRRLISADLLAVAHDLSDGGLAVALAELGLPARPGASGTGGDYALDDASAAMLFGEDHGRALVAFDAASLDAVLAACEGVPLRVLGASGGERLVVRGAEGVVIDVGVASLVEAWAGSLPAWMDA